MPRHTRIQAEQQTDAMLDRWGIRELEQPHFLAGDVANALGLSTTVPLHKFIVRYGLEPERLGKGRQGTRRYFAPLDVYRLALIARMTSDGFVSDVIEEANDAVQDDNLLGVDREGNSQPTVLVLQRGAKAPAARVFGAASYKHSERDYYMLALDELREGINRQLQKDRK